MHFSVDLTSIYCPQKYLWEEREKWKSVREDILSLFLHISIDLNENDTCGRITFPFITAVERSNATYTTIDLTGSGEKSMAKHPRVPHTPLVMW